MIQYKGYTIQEDHSNPYSKFMFYPTKEGIQHESDYTGDGWQYCGNCDWSSSIEWAKKEIDTLIPKVLVWESILLKCFVAEIEGEETPIGTGRTIPVAIENLLQYAKQAGKEIEFYTWGRR